MGFSKFSRDTLNIQISCLRVVHQLFFNGSANLFRVLDQGLVASTWHDPREKKKPVELIGAIFKFVVVRSEIFS